MIGRLMQVGLVVLMLAGPLASARRVVAQDGGEWTCDGGENDVLIAAQAAYAAGEYGRALELATIAEDLCQADFARWREALDLKARAAALTAPTPTDDPCVNTITVGDIVTATLTDVAYVTGYCFEGQAGTMLRISMTAISGDLDPLLVIADAALTQNYSRDDDLDDNGEALLFWVVPTTGTYLIITARQNLETGTTTGDFRLNLQDADTFSTALDEVSELAALGDQRGTKGDIEGAIAAYQEGLAITQRIGARATETILLYAIGQDYNVLGQYREALAALEASLVIDRELGNRADEAATLTQMALVYANLQQFEEAVASSETALAIRRERGERLEEAVVLNNLGFIYSTQGDFDAAVAQYEAALTIYRELGNQSEVVTTLSNMALDNANRARFTEALAAYEEALTLARTTQDSSAEARILNFRGMVYFNQGRYSEALADFEVAQSLSQQQGNPFEEGTALNNIGLVYGGQGRYTKALAMFERALELQRSAGLPTDVSSTLANMAFVYSNQGRMGEALVAFEQALAIARELGDRPTEALLLNNIGLQYYGQGRYAEALSNFEASLALARELGLTTIENQALSNMGTVYASLGRYEEGLASFEEALARGLTYQSPALVAIAYLNIGAIQTSQGRYEEALTNFARATEYFTESGNRAETAMTALNTGVVYMLQGRYADADASFAEALTIYQEAGALGGVAATMSAVGNNHELAGEPSAAIEAYRQTLDLLAQLLNAAGSDESVSTLATSFDKSNIAVRFINLLVAAGDATLALDYAERGRALLSRSELGSDAIDFRANLSDQSLVERETELRLALADAQAILDSLRRDAGASAEAIQAADAALTTARRAYDQHLERMQLEGGFLARQVATQVATLARIQKTLPADTTLVVYAVGEARPVNDRVALPIADPRAVAFIITRTGLEAVVLEVTPNQIAEQVATFNADRLNNAAALSTLYDALIGPLADKLTTTRLMISPDGPLNYVPFAALQAPDGSYLIDQYAISMIASGTTLVLLNDRAAGDAGQVTDHAPTAGLVLAQPSAAGLSRLQNARREALEVGALLGVEANINATEADLRADVAGAGVLHISAHATLDPFAPLYSVIHLGEGDGYDGRLEVREIYELDLSQTKLVILSGCETGSGGDGENFGLLNRAFLGAGANQVVASLWSVDDAATATLITNFVEAWGEVDNAADALQAAMLATREQYPDPYYWAAFTLNGLP